MLRYLLFVLVITCSSDILFMEGVAMTNEEICDKIDELNKSAYDCFYANNMEAFDSTIDNFYASGITDEENFEQVRHAYRLDFVPFTINKTYVGFQADKDLGDYEIRRYIGEVAPEASLIPQIHKEIYFPHIISVQDFIAQYGYDEYEMETYEDGGPSTRDVNKRRRLMADYIIIFSDLYSNQFDKNLYSDIKDINNDDLTNTTKNFIKKILKLIQLREKCYLTYNFTLFEEALPLNEELKKMSLSEKYQTLFSPIKKLYKDDSIVGTDLESYIKFERDYNIRFSNYLQGKYIDRKRYFDFKNGKFSKDPLFYLELAFYLCFPGSNEIEKLLNAFGFSIKSQFLEFDQRVIGGKDYHILYKDLCKWIDAGIDYNLINEILGFELEQNTKKIVQYPIIVSDE